METIGRYQVVRPLGHGGMGHVFLAHDPTLERDVALKLLHRETTKSTLHDEAKALAALSHPGIVTIFEIGVHQGQDFIAMEYLPGRTLREMLAEHPARDTLIAIFVKVAAAVGAAHRAGILHRDIKPENIVVTDRGDVKVVDFGIARRLGNVTNEFTRAVTARELVDALRRTLPPEMTMGTDTEVSAGTETMFGTPAYMAPEVLIGQPATAASDIYSLGVVLFECLAGHRPHEGTSLVEMIAQVIDGGAPKLDDPLGGLVDGMLARDPAARPSLDEIDLRLSRSEVAPEPPRPRRHLLAITLGAVGVLALGVGAWQLARRTSAAPAAPLPAELPLVTTSIAVAPFEIEIPSYGQEPPHPKFVADTLAGLLGAIRHANITGVRADDRATAQRASAKYFVTGHIVEQGLQLHATLDVLELETGAHRPPVVVDRPAAQIAKLMDVLALDIARAVAPAATLDEHNPARASAFYDQGMGILETGRFTDARPYFEQAVDADPARFDAWYQLTLVLSWMDADQDLVLAATTRALETAPAGRKHELMRGVAQYLQWDFGGARAVLEPLDQPGTSDLRDVLYYLGEANWHDGRHAGAFGYFMRALVIDPRFRPATVHAMQYAIARRDAKNAQYIVGLAAESPQWTELAAGHYKQLAESGTYPFKLWAQRILDQPLSPDVAAAFAHDELDVGTHRVALAMGDEASRELATVWKLVVSRPPEALAATFYGVELLGEVVLAAGMKDEARELVRFLAEHSKHRAVRGYQRFSILAAALLGDPTLILHDGLSERNSRLADASAAELAGDRARAAVILTELVGDPSASWDYPERAALLRNLRALHRRKEVAALCADTLHPAIYRTAFLVLRRLCK